MSRIDERLEVMKVDTAEMTEEQKFSAATGLTFYDEELANNEWYVPGGAANVSTEAASTEEDAPVDDAGQTDENVTDPVVEPTETTESTDEPVVEPTETTESTDEPVEETTETTESTDEPVTEPVVEPADDVDPTPSEIEIETQP